MCATCSPARRARAGAAATTCASSRGSDRPTCCSSRRPCAMLPGSPLPLGAIGDGDELLRTPWSDTIIYEAHVKGLTKRRPGVREDLRGTYAGLASEEAIAYLQLLGVTAVELLPVHHIIDEPFLHERGLTNYWG